MKPMPPVTAFVLKVAAIVGMTCNHVANVFGSELPGGAMVALYSLGGLTFPIMAYRLVDHQRQNLVLCALGLLGELAVSSFCDWGIIGPLMILLFWHFHDRPRGVALAMLVPFLSLGLPALSWAVSDPALLSLGVLGYYTVGFGLATALMLNYNGQRGRPLKWFFYGYYPGHLLALWALAQALAL